MHKILIRLTVCLVHGFHSKSFTTCLFQVPACQNCGGILKPDVTFFGDNVPKLVVDFIFEKVHECDGLLVIGSSLSVS